MEIKIEKVMDRKKIADTIGTALDVGIDMLNKKKLENEDKGRLKVLRTMGTFVSNGVFMVQQETAQQRTAVVLERMKQLGYESEPTNKLK